VSTNSSGTEATGGSSSNPAISPDGNFVIFESAATNLVAGDTNGVQDLFLKDLRTGEVVRISTDSDGAQATGGESAIFSVSSDGRFVVFSSLATNLVPGDTNGQRDIFIKDLKTGAVVRANTDNLGGQATGGASFTPSMSSDGLVVSFASAATNLLSGDTNAQRDFS
jgi:Tol biopolymer transport system component